MPAEKHLLFFSQSIRSRQFCTLTLGIEFASMNIYNLGGSLGSFVATVNAFDLNASKKIIDLLILQSSVDGDWTAWSSWASISCTISCGTQGMKHRTRTCTDPPPQYNGSECASPDYTEEFQTCDASSACGGWCQLEP